MSHAQLEAATGSPWRVTNIRRGGDSLGDQVLVWTDEERGTEIVAALARDATQWFVIRYSVNPLRALDVAESPAGECALT